MLSDEAPAHLSTWPVKCSWSCPGMASVAAEGLQPPIHSPGLWEPPVLPCLLPSAQQGLGQGQGQGGVWGCVWCWRAALQEFWHLCQLLNCLFELAPLSVRFNRVPQHSSDCVSTVPSHPAWSMEGTQHSLQQQPQGFEQLCTQF